MPKRWGEIIPSFVHQSIKQVVSRNVENLDVHDFDRVRGHFKNLPKTFNLGSGATKLLKKMSEKNNTQFEKSIQTWKIGKMGIRQFLKTLRDVVAIA